VALELASRVRWQKWSGVVAALLVALYITLAAPISGMSINPARSFAPAVFAGQFEDLWIYFVAPPLGAFAAAELHRRRSSR
jgi:aquaporin Z